ncbi:MAG TPA: hypothetical protein PKU74_02510, partial [Candidatus Omnitrophota bacterium]|nr:hypothetical protein [Candidatus Omnitrophota bacterium]
NFDYPLWVEDDGNGVILNIGEGLPGFEAGQARITFDFERGMNRLYTWTYLNDAADKGIYSAILDMLDFPANVVISADIENENSLETLRSILDKDGIRSLSREEARDTLHAHLRGKAGFTHHVVEYKHNRQYPYKLTSRKPYVSREEVCLLVHELKRLAVVEDMALPDMRIRVVHFDEDPSALFTVTPAGIDLSLTAFYSETMLMETLLTLLKAGASSSPISLQDAARPDEEEALRIVGPRVLPDTLRPVTLSRVHSFLARHDYLRQAYYHEDYPVYPKGCESCSILAGEALENDGLDARVLFSPRRGHYYLSMLVIQENGVVEEMILDYTANQIGEGHIAPLFDTRANIKARYPEAYNLYWAETSRAQRWNDIMMTEFYVIHIMIYDLAESIKEANELADPLIWNAMADDVSRPRGQGDNASRQGVRSDNSREIKSSSGVSSPVDMSHGERSRKRAELTDKLSDLAHKMENAEKRTQEAQDAIDALQPQRAALQEEVMALNIEISGHKRKITQLKNTLARASRNMGRIRKYAEKLIRAVKSKPEEREMEARAELIALLRDKKRDLEKSARVLGRKERGYTGEISRNRHEIISMTRMWDETYAQLKRLEENGAKPEVFPEQAKDITAKAEAPEIQATPELNQEDIRYLVESRVLKTFVGKYLNRRSLAPIRAMEDEEPLRRLARLMARDMGLPDREDVLDLIVERMMKVGVALEDLEVVFVVARTRPVATQVFYVKGQVDMKEISHNPVLLQDLADLIEDPETVKDNRKALRVPLKGLWQADVLQDRSKRIIYRVLKQDNVPTHIVLALMFEKTRYDAHPRFRTRMPKLLQPYQNLSSEEDLQALNKIKLIPEDIKEKLLDYGVELVSSSPVNGKIWERTLRQIYFTPMTKFIVPGGRLDQFFRKRVPVLKIMSGCNRGCLICLFGRANGQRVMPFAQIEEALETLRKVRDEYVRGLQENGWDLPTQEWLLELLLNQPEVQFKEQFADFIRLAREYASSRCLANQQAHTKMHAAVRQAFLDLLHGVHQDAFLEWLKASLIQGVSICQDLEPVDYYDAESGKDIADVVDAIHSHGFDVWLVTHGWSRKDTRAQRAAERLNALPYPFQVNVSFHVWHQDVFQALYEAGQERKAAVNAEALARLEEKYRRYFVNVIRTFKDKELILRNVHDGMRKVTAVNEMQARILASVKEDAGVLDEQIWDWPVEWTKGRADAVRKQFDIETLPMRDSYGGLNRAFGNIYLNFSINGDVTFYIENVTLEDRYEKDVLLGTMLDEGYDLERTDRHDTPEMFQYRVKAPAGPVSSPVRLDIGVQKLRTQAGVGSVAVTRAGPEPVSSPVSRPQDYPQKLIPQMPAQPLRFIGKGWECRAYSLEDFDYVIKVKRSVLGFWRSSLRVGYTSLIRTAVRVALSGEHRRAFLQRTAASGEIRQETSRRLFGKFGILAALAWKAFKLFFGMPVRSYLGAIDESRRFLASYQIGEKYFVDKGLMPWTAIVLDYPVRVKRDGIVYRSRARRKVFQRKIVPLKQAFMNLKFGGEYSDERAKELIDYMVEARLSYWENGIVINAFKMDNYCVVAHRGGHYDSGDWTFVETLDDAFRALGRFIKANVLEQTLFIERYSSPEVSRYFTERMLENFDISRPETRQALEHLWASSEDAQDIAQEYRALYHSALNTRVHPITGNEISPKRPTGSSVSSPVDLDLSFPWAPFAAHEEFVEFSECPLCGSRHYAAMLPMRVNGKKFAYERCLGCGVVFLNPQPTASYLERLYSNEYFAQEEEIPHGSLFSKGKARSVSGLLERKALEYKTAHNGLLQVGVQSPYFLNALKTLGWQNVSGVDLSA